MILRFFFEVSRTSPAAAATKEALTVAAALSWSLYT
jgi:hypothetical protein